jgi:hypothetical protein
VAAAATPMPLQQLLCKALSLLDFFKRMQKTIYS